MKIQDIKKYLIHCQNCKKQQPHYIFKISLKRGVRLMCSKCGHKKNQYHKINTLHEYSLTKPEGSNNEPSD